MILDPLLLSRLQFAWVVAFHILLPAFTIGLARYIAFLGVLLFGRRLVPRWAHLVAALMVAAGTLFSAFWILSANSWMQTPVGYEVIDGRFFPQDWLKIIFNPSFPYRLMHTVVAFYI